MEHIKETLKQVQGIMLDRLNLNGVPEKTLNNAKSYQNNISDPKEMKRRDMNVSSMNNTFEKFKVKPGTEQSLAAFKKYATGDLGTPFLVCVGEYGCGKTHLLEALVIKRNQMGIFCRVLKFNKFIQDLKNSIGSYQIPSYDEILTNHCNAKMLFLDDIGMGSKETSWYNSVLEMLVDERYHHRLETVLTMNNESWKNLPARIKSRLADGEVCTIVENTGADYRIMK